jgi:hypothetical protein
MLPPNSYIAQIPVIWTFEQGAPGALAVTFWRQNSGDGAQFFIDRLSFRGTAASDIAAADAWIKLGATGQKLPLYIAVDGNWVEFADVVLIPAALPSKSALRCARKSHASADLRRPCRRKRSSSISATSLSTSRPMVRSIGGASRPGILSGSLPRECILRFSCGPLMADGQTHCQWCGESFTALSKGGRIKRFCSPPCRMAFHSAARRWIARAIETGLLSIADLKSQTAPRLTCASPAEPVLVSPATRGPSKANCAVRPSGGLGGHFVSEAEHGR